ncbi:LLM class flavin-dependent oxidoreductase [Thalassomonas viridans]|uniref:LLM class flavin-dependent oxidoreductase n=1 Tax=Thalassomonas viridans TaxID=137584 RepID=A0AAF0CDT3_9GAMM|nr:LLM class flavin-dependent oxidoreductase [Thalassomonas viridans]WDE08805.1 LLM class flavin-dependent oxidoreductase [Thalassomonas viridans]
MYKSLFTTLDHHPGISDLSTADVYGTAHSYAQLADELGYSCFWIGEHHFLQNVGSIPNPAVLLSSLAQCTKNIRLGPAVAVLPMRDATLTAENYAMVDIISGGRLNMGVGTGQVATEYQNMGIDFENRRDAFGQSLDSIISYWTQHDLDSESSLNIRPVQSPMPPLYIATITPESAYRAGKNGQSVLTIVSPGGNNLSLLQEIIEAHNKGKSETIAPGIDTEVVVTVYAYAAETEESAIETAAASLRNFSPSLQDKSVAEIRSNVQGMVANNTALFGTAGQISKQLQHYRDIGVKHINFLANFGGMQPGQVAESIRLLALA